MAALILLARPPAPAGACEDEGGCGTPVQAVQCPANNSSGTGTFTFDVPKDATNFHFLIADVTLGTIVYNSEHPELSGSICSGTQMSVQTTRTTLNDRKDLVTVTYTITNSGSGNSAETHNVGATAFWDRQSDLELTKDWVDGMDAARKMSGPVGADAEIVYKLTVTNHGPAPADVRFTDSVGGFLAVTRVIQDTGPNAEILEVRNGEVVGEWSPLAAGRTVTFFVIAKFIGHDPRQFNLTNTASVRAVNRVEPSLDPHSNDASATVEIKPVADSKVRTAGAGGAVGTAAPPAAAKRTRRATASAVAVRSVRVAILRLSRGVKPLTGQLPARPTKKRGKCQWLASRRGNFAERKADHGVCNSPIWLRASGTRRWKLGLADDLPPGRYVLYSRATGSNGISESNFTAKDRNRKAFRVR